MVEKRAADLSEVPSEYMECRAWRQHLFVKRHDSVVTRDGRVIEVHKWRECDRCGYETTTIYMVDRNGHWTRMSAKTHYSDNYLITNGGDIDPDDIKNAYLNGLGHAVGQQSRLKAV